VFCEQGFPATTVEDICARAGFTRGAFYSNFSTTDEQFARFCREAGLDAIGADPDFRTNRLRVAHRARLVPELALAIATRPVSHWLGGLDRAFVPHLDTPDHPESEALGKVADLYRRDGMPFWALRDGQVLVVDGDLPDAVLL